MAKKTCTIIPFFLLISFSILHLSMAGDADILTDFIIPPLTNPSKLDAKFFTFTGMRKLFVDPSPSQFKILKATMAEFPALNGQSESYAVLQFPPEGTNPPHTHPRSSELLFVVEGCLEVAFIDTFNKIYKQTLQTGDMFVFPKGLVHYQYNADPKFNAVAISAFGSANPGTVPLPNTLFITGIDDVILAKSFKTDIATIQHLKAGLSPPKA